VFGFAKVRNRGLKSMLGKATLRRLGNIHGEAIRLSIRIAALRMLLGKVEIGRVPASWR
jgi:hypothetical protein